MVNRCVAVCCSNQPSGQISLFKFPRDPALRKEWARQVQRTRDNWEPTAHSSLCSEHFTANCFEADSALASSFGISKRRRLKPGAIPTLFERPETATRKRPAVSPSKEGKKKRSAFEKRERLRVRN